MSLYLKGKKNQTKNIAAIHSSFFLKFQTDLKKNAFYVKINLYLRGLHPLATTGLIPLLLLVILNIKVVRGINILTRKRTRKKYPEVDATSLTTEDLVKLNQGKKT